VSRVIAAVFFVVALAGCGDTLQELLPHASCNNTSLGTCQDYSGPGGTALTTFQDACTTAAGTNASTECTLTSRVGSCSIPTGVPGVTTAMRYYASIWNATTAQAQCSAAGGTFTAG
jgi:hypothetical protein